MPKQQTTIAMHLFHLSKIANPQFNRLPQIATSKKELEDGEKSIHKTTASQGLQNPHSKSWEPLSGQDFHGTTYKTVISKTLRNTFIQPFPLFTKIVEKLNHFIKTVNAAAHHFQQKLMAEYPKTFWSWEDEPLVLDPFYLSSDVSDSTSCSSLEHHFWAISSDAKDPIN